MNKLLFFLLSMIFCLSSCSRDSNDDSIIDEPMIQTHKGHEYVDLGLPGGTLWATCNIGANKPEDYGDYFAWGETKTKSIYDWSTYNFFVLNQYNNSSGYGTVDNMIVLELGDDAAHVNWGGSWRMPTKAELDELVDANNCTWTWITQNGVNGYKVTSKKNSNSLFLPAAGYRYDSNLSRVGSDGNYWSSSLFASDSGGACCLIFYSDSMDWYNVNLCIGGSVRPVCVYLK